MALLLLRCCSALLLSPRIGMAVHRPKKKVLDALDALSDDSDVSSSSSSEGEEEQQQPAKKQRTDISLEDLQKQGYNSGPSVLYMKPPEEEGQQNWAWYDRPGTLQLAAEWCSRVVQQSGLAKH